MPFATRKTPPFVKIAPAFITGILLQQQLQPALWLPAMAGCLLAFFLFVLGRLPVAWQFRLRLARGMAVTGMVLLAGMFVAFHPAVSTQAAWVGRLYRPGDALHVTLDEQPVEKEKTHKVTARVNALRRNGRWIKTEGKLFLYIRRQHNRPPPAYGTQLLFAKPLTVIRNNGNPGVFDYARYCAFRGVFHQVFLDTCDYVALPGNHGNRVQWQLFQWQAALLRCVQQFIPGKTRQGVAEALLIGYRGDLDRELLQAYSNTGVVHIIAISGLHLGMIYGLLLAGFSLFGPGRLKSWVEGICILAVLWCFTLLAGAVPSILRSAVMFSFLVIGRLLQRESNLYNSLAASACCLLLYHPFYLWDVGFQLSYAAVLGIIVFQPYFNRWWTPGNRLLRMLWQLVAVTLSAQIITLPLILFYFHRFPVWFLPGNLVVIPLSGFILYGLLVLLLLQWIPPAAAIAGRLLARLIDWMNVFVSWLDQLPFSSVRYIYLNLLQVAVCYLLLLGAFHWLRYRNRKGLLGMGFCLLILLAARTLDRLYRPPRFVVFSIPGKAAAEIAGGNTAYYWGDSSLFRSSAFQQDYLLPAHRYAGPVSLQPLRGHACICKGKTILWYTAKTVAAATVPAHPLPVDILVVSGSPALDFSRLPAQFACRQLVFDSSNPLWKIEKWKKACDSLHLRFHSVPEQGAFVINL